MSSEKGVSTSSYCDLTRTILWVTIFRVRGNTLTLTTQKL